MNLINILVKNSQTNLKINPLLVQELQVVPYGTKYKARLVLTSGHNYFLTNNDQEVFDTKLEAEQLLSTVEQSILAELISSVYKPAGSLEKAEILPSLLIKANLGNVYNITETFTTTIDFVEGAGIEFAAGTNIVIIDSGNEVYKFDVLGNFVKLTAIDIDIENGAFAGKNVEEALDTLSVITQNIPRIEKPVLENEIEVVLEPMGTVNTQFDMTKESIENSTLWIDDVKVVEKGVALDGYILTEIQGGYELTGGGYDIAFYYESGEYGSKGDIVDLNAKSGTLKFLVNIKTYVDYEIDKLDLGDKNVQSDWNQTNDTEDNYIQNKPTIPTVPTNVSAFTNDAGYLTSHQSLANYYTKTEVDSLVGDIETALDTILGV